MQDDLSRQRFFDHVIQCAGFRSQSEAEDAVRATLAALSSILPTTDANHIAAQLPDWLDSQLQATSPRDSASFLDQIAATEGVSVGFAREHAGIILQALGAELSPEGETYLCAMLPPEIAELMLPRAKASTPVRVTTHQERSTLASGRPGSRHPLSESPTGQPQSDSIAQTPDPHADTKLSESRGSTQERQKETIASGRPRRNRSLSEGKA